MKYLDVIPTFSTGRLILGLVRLTRRLQGSTDSQQYPLSALSLR